MGNSAVSSTGTYSITKKQDPSKCYLRTDIESTNKGMAKNTVQILSP